MWILGLSVVAGLVIYVFHKIFMLKNTKLSKRSSPPPGSMGLPFIGETIQFMIPSYSLDLHTFIKKRIKRFGPIFGTSLFGQPVVISTDPEFNSYLVQQEGKLVENFLGPLSNVFTQQSDNCEIYTADYIHKYFRCLTLSHVGAESIREKLLPQLEEMTKKTLHKWSTQTSIEVYESSSHMAFHFFAKHYFGYDAGKLPETGRIAEQLFTVLSKGSMTVPLNIPGTTFHKCLKEAKTTFTIMKRIVEEKRSSPENYQGDFLDQIINDKKVGKILTDDQTVYFVLGVWFATCLALSSLVTLFFKFLSEDPSVLEELRVEHEEIIKARDKPSSSLTWDEYKSMKFTQQVINEALRFEVLFPGILRTTIKDIQVKGYTIPAGWTIVLTTPTLHLNSKICDEDPLTFNPRRWKDLDSYTVSKNFKPFGGGSRQCPGAELTRASMATFLHVLVTKFRWTKIREGNVVRNPMLGFGDGFHIKIWEKDT
ncbi:hypothetical protein RIF29_01996 [Crotalaria pallida]|uniref:Cytochrome P450 n=1 Tax=Crotalaria pallida TaxID=3830 RepID=A0AAN9IXX0_CROPI